MKEQKIFEDIPESEGSCELPDHFLEDEIFENLDGWSDKNLPEKVILAISFFFFSFSYKSQGANLNIVFNFCVSLGEEIGTIQGTTLLV